MRASDLKRPTLWVGLPALAGAAAAFLVPGAAGGLATGASVLALAALAMLAGHAWALYIVAPAQASLVGRLSPELLDPLANVFPASVAAIILVTSAPAFWLAARAIRRRVASSVLLAHQS
jgi:hypothetical protein